MGSKFKKWLVLKLGGYLLIPPSVHTININKFNSVELYSQRMSSIFENYPEYIIKTLAREIAEEIVEKKLYEINRCKDYKTGNIIYRMKVTVVDTKGGEIL